MAVAPYRATGYLGIAKQSVQGTPVAPSKFFVLQKQDFRAKQKISDFRLGNSRDLAFSVKEMVNWGGVFETLLYADEGTALLAFLMGTDTISGAGDPYTHTLSFTDPVKYLTAEAANYENQQIDRVTDCLIDKWTLTAEAGKGPALVQGALIGCNSSRIATGSAATVSFSNGVSEGPMRLSPDGVLTLTGPTDATTLQAQIQKVTMEVQQYTSEEMGPGQIYPIALFQQGRMVTLKFSAIFSGPNMHDLTFFGGNAGTGPSAIVGQGSFICKFTSQAAPEHSIALTMANVNFKGVVNKFDKDAKTGTIDVEAVGIKVSSSMPLSVVGKNAISTAYAP